MMHGGEARGVSIPFKRESTCEREAIARRIDNILEFQFPSNGKARVNFQRCRNDTPYSVSIPFKRESTCELKFMVAKNDQNKKGFNSLQTGKHVWTEEKDEYKL